MQVLQYISKGSRLYATQSTDDRLTQFGMLAAQQGNDDLHQITRLLLCWYEEFAVREVLMLTWAHPGVQFELTWSGNRDIGFVTRKKGDIGGAAHNISWMISPEFLILIYFWVQRPDFRFSMVYILKNVE